ncbi:hypothetical protein BGZ92_005188 [Podila epicladia]|nr:hypothetical protein BGZ92_005188 [Podila epicladia]
MLSMQSGVLSATSGPAEFKTAGDNAQRACAYVAKPYVPKFAWAALSELLPAMFGIAVLIIFGSRMELWQDLRKRLFHSSKDHGGRITMGQITKNSEDRHVPQQRQNRQSKQQAGRIQGIKGLSDSFYDEELGGRDDPSNPYGSRVNLSLNTTRAVLGGPTLKTSVQHITNAARDQRSPPHSPAQQHYSCSSTKGGVPPDPSNWPSWPSTYTATPTSPTCGSGKSLYSSDNIDLLTSPSRGNTYGQRKDDMMREASRYG